MRITIPEEARARSESPRIRQTGYLVSRSQKVDALGRILDHENPTSALVFCRTRNEVEELAQALAGHGYRAEALHGGMAQKERDRVMKRFRDGTAELLLATDVAARGLDIGNLTHVINYDVPSAPESYVHRIGRTGRAGREGVALTLIEARERRLIGNIERLTGRRLDMRPVPSVADLRARQLETTQNALRETLAAGGGEPFRVVVESLGREFDVLDIAAAAVKLAHEADERVSRQRASAPVAEPSAFDAPAYTDRPGRKEQTDRPRHRDAPPPSARPARSPDRPIAPRGLRPPAAPSRRPPRSRSRASTSPSAKRRACARATWWAPSPAKPRSRAATSARSRWPSATPWSTCARAAPTRCWWRCARPPSAARR